MTQSRSLTDIALYFMLLSLMAIARWRTAMQGGLVPISLGLILASGYVLTRAADHNMVAYCVTALTTIAAVKSRIHPLWLLAVAGALGVAGFI